MTSRPRAVDHQQVIVGDLDRARADYERLGFFVAPKMRHSMGTANHLILFPSDFIELFGDFDRVESPQWKAALGPSAGLRGPGPVAVFSEDAEGDREAMRAAGVELPEVKTFTRPVPLPGGGEGQVHCSIAGAGNPGHPGVVFFYCQQHRPENVWIREWMSHPNTATGLSSITFAARDPEAHRPYIEACFGSRHVRSVGGGLAVEVARGAAVELLPAGRLASRFGGIETGWSPVDGDRGVAIGVRVRDVGEAARLLEWNGVPFERTMGVVRIPPHAAQGVLVEFAE